MGNIDFIIWQRGCTGLGDWDIGHWHGKDQQWRWPGSWSGWRKVGHRSCSWRCCRRCFEDAAEDVGEYAVADVVVQVIKVKGFRYSRAGHTNNRGYCAGAKSLSLSSQMCPNVSKVSAFAPNFRAFMFQCKILPESVDPGASIWHDQM